ncbi:MAG: response regulator [Anaerolineae bacterium]|nr:response regulator [Anaerolineae bacterium]
MSQALIIDDNAKNISILSHLLSNEGMDSIQITNPTMLDATIQTATDIRVVFLDLEMPTVDGFQLLKKLKADSRFSAVPIVAYTVHVSEIQVAHQHGFDGFLGKPLDSDKFPNQLARILQGEPVWE